MSLRCDIFHCRAYYNRNHHRYVYVNHSSTTYPIHPSSRFCFGGAGGRYAPGLHQPFEMSLKNRPNFRSNSTGKEHDEETGYSYFGARYMDHELMTMWLSIDPLADKYPSISPYAYCAWNPVKLVDPDGREVDGYEGSNGQYQWFDEHSEQSFVDENGVAWHRVTGNLDTWTEATAIREANIRGLECLGYNRSDAEQDVRLYNEENPLFTKESHLITPQKYTSLWEIALNSDEGDARQSPEIKNTGYSLKYYPNKGEQKGVNSLGLVKTSGLGHFLEGALEAVERSFHGSKADADPMYDMHYNNARSLIYLLHNSPVKRDDFSPSVTYSNYHRSGGMKLP